MADVVFKGMAREAQQWGIPVELLIGATAVSLFAGVLGYVLIGYMGLMWALVFLPLCAAARVISEYDDMALRQWWLWLRTRGINYFRGGFKRWGGSSYAPIEYPDDRPWRKWMIEKPVSRFLPYSRRVTDTIASTKNFEYLSVWHVRGRSSLGASADEMEGWLNELNSAICGIGSSYVTLWIHLWHRNEEPCVETGFDNAFCARLDREYCEMMNSSALMRNDYFLTVIFSPTAGSPLAMFAKVEKMTVSERADRRSEAIRMLDEVNLRLGEALTKYDATLLRSDGKTAENIAALALPLRAGRHEPVCETRGRYCDYMAPVRPITHPTSNVGELRIPGATRTFGIMEIVEYPDVTGPGTLNELLAMKSEFLMTHSFQCQSIPKALKLVKRQIGWLKSTQDVGTEQISDLPGLQNDLVARRVILGKHHATFTVFGDSVEYVRRELSEASEIMSRHQVATGQGDEAAEAAFMAQFAANFDKRPHPRALNSRNLLGLCSFHNLPRGKRSGNAWGPSVITLKTAAGTKFDFNWHPTPANEDWTGRRAAGSAVFLGKTGTGKTSGLSLMLAMSQKFRPRMMLLDSRKGMSVLTCAVGGHYEEMRHGYPTGVNVMQEDATHSKILFIIGYVRGLLELDGHGITHEDGRDVERAVRGVMEMHPRREDRRFGLLLRYLDPVGVSGRPSVHDRLLRWCDGGVYGWATDNPHDKIDLSRCTTNGIDVTSIIAHKELRHGIMPVILHKCDAAMDGSTPFILSVDECQNIVADSYFQPYLQSNEREIRAKNGIIVLSTQEPNALLETGVGKTVVQQAASVIAFHNGAGRRDDYVDGLGLHEEVFKLIKNLGEFSRHAVIKQGDMVTVADFSLRGMSDMLTVLSGTADNAARYDAIVHRLGTDDPEVILPIYFGEAVGQQRIAA